MNHTQLDLGSVVRALEEPAGGLHADRAVRILGVASSGGPPQPGVLGEKDERAPGIARKDNALDDHRFAKRSSCDKATSQKLSMNA